MKTFPEFSWEYIITVCETNRDTAQQLIASGSRPEIYKSPLINSETLLALCAKLREHPEIRKLVPLMTLNTLRWFPDEDHEVDVNYVQSKAQYIISVLSKNEAKGMLINEEKAVALDDLADELYAYITKLRDD